MQRPALNEIPMQEAMDLAEPKMIVTMNENQWDSLLESCYLQGDVLIELDPTGLPRRAYRLAQASSPEGRKVVEEQ